MGQHHSQRATEVLTFCPAVEIAVRQRPLRHQHRSRNTGLDLRSLKVPPMSPMAIKAGGGDVLDICPEFGSTGFDYITVLAKGLG